MPLRWRLLAVTVAAPLLVLGAAAVPRLAPGGEGPGAAEPVTSRALLVSGRDDHGLLAMHEVPLADQPAGSGPAGRLHDGTLVELLEVAGRMHRVRAGDVVGWLDDEQLRSRVHLVGPPPTCAPAVGGRVLPPGEQAVLLEVVGDGARVRLVRQPDVIDVVPAAWLSEVAPRVAPGRCLPVEDTRHDHDGRSRPPAHGLDRERARHGHGGGPGRQAPLDLAVLGRV